MLKAQDHPFLVVGALAFDTPVAVSGPVRGGGRLTGQMRPRRIGGGGANAACALVQAGHAATLVSVVADSAEGRARVAAAEALGIDTRLIVTAPGPDRTTLVLIDPAGERTVLVLNPEGAILPPDLPTLATSAALALAQKAAGVYLRAAFPGAEALGAACAGPVVCHWPGPRAQLACADVLIGSADDVGDGALADLRAAARGHGARDSAALVLTDGAKPVRIVAGASEAVLIPPPTAHVVDATGAGDVFAAGVLEALAQGAALPAAVAHGCQWGARAVGHDGSSPAGLTLPPFSLSDDGGDRTSSPTDQP